MAKLFDEIMKFNPYHGKDGRFASADAATSFTYAPGKSTAHSKAIERAKEADGEEKGFKGTLYHGSPSKDIEEFDMERAGKNTSSGEKLLFFTDSKQMAEDFSYERLEGSSTFFQRRGEKGRVYEVDVEMKNPLDFRKLSDADIDNVLKLDADGLLSRDEVKMLAANNHQLLKAGLTLTASSLTELGYDGLIANTGKAGHNSLEYAVVDSKQAKIKKSMEGDATMTKTETGVEKAAGTFNIFKADQDKRLVFGWASVAITADGQQIEDVQKDMIDPEDLEEAAYSYVLNFRDTGEEHIPTLRKKGKLVESCVFTKEKQQAIGIPEGIVPEAWWVGFYIEDDDAWEKIKNGTYTMFSIEGKAKRVPVEKSAEERDPKMVAKSFNEILGIEPTRTISKSDPDRFDQIVEKYNPYHDAKGRFSSANSFASYSGKPGRNYGATDAKDAVDQVKDTARYTIDGKKNSLDGYLDENGNLTPEREAVHREIIDKLLKGKVPVEGQATMTMLGGGPASGKSSVMNPDTSNDKNAVTIDPDMMKKMLPGFKELAEKDTRAADFFHEESSALAKRFAETAYRENYNVVYDGTGDGSVKSVQKKIDAARASGYRVEAKYVSIDTEEAVRRNQKRYDDAVARGETPRLPPVQMVINTHTKCTDISVTMADKFDRIEIWDNNGARGQQKMVATGGSGKHLTAVKGQEASFDRYLSKGAKGLEGFTTLPDGQVVPVE